MQQGPARHALAHQADVVVDKAVAVDHPDLAQEKGNLLGLALGDVQRTLIEEVVGDGASVRLQRQRVSREMGCTVNLRDGLALPVPCRQHTQLVCTNSGRALVCRQQLCSRCAGRG